MDIIILVAFVLYKKNKLTLEGHINIFIRFEE